MGAAASLPDTGRREAARAASGYFPGSRGPHPRSLPTAPPRSAALGAALRAVRSGLAGRKPTQGLARGGLRAAWKFPRGKS